MNDQLSAEQAEKIARDECARRGWCFLNPVKVENQGRHWLLITNADKIGMNARITVDKGTLLVVHAQIASR
jgi:hypothetical protein